MPYVPYTHGEPLLAIREVLEGEPEDVRDVDRLSGLPLHVLSSILLSLVDSSLECDAFYAIHSLISASHLNFRIRDACLRDPALWNRALSLNGVGARMFQAIVDRAGTLPLSMSFREDENLSTSPDAWRTLMGNLHRLKSLHVEVDETYQGNKAKFLLALLTVNAPALEECIVVFQGHRNVPLNCFVMHTRIPLLRRLELINCSIPLDRCRFPRLTRIVMRSITGKPFISSPYDCLRLRGQFQHLRQLVLWNVFQSHHAPNPFPGLPPVELPVLESFILFGDGSVCKELAEVFRLPPRCRRSITICFPRNRECVHGDAIVAMTAASLFIPNIEFATSVLEVTSTIQTLKLTSIRGEPVIKLNFVITDSLKFPAPGPIALLIRAVSLLPPISWLPGYQLTGQDNFSFILWHLLATERKAIFSSITLLNLCFDNSTPAPHFFVPLLELMSNVEMVAATVPQVYSNPSFINIITRQELFPRLTSLGIPFDGGDPVYIPQVLRCREAIKQVVFYISPAYLAEIEEDGVDFDVDPYQVVDLIPEGIEIVWLRV
ncbi:hypothetical protein MD484_g8537, partial [Candolleomyces efflorescens]